MNVYWRTKQQPYKTIFQQKSRHSKLFSVKPIGGKCGSFWLFLANKKMYGWCRVVDDSDIAQKELTIIWGKSFRIFTVGLWLTLNHAIRGPTVKIKKVPQCGIWLIIAIHIFFSIIHISHGDHSHIKTDT